MRYNVEIEFDKIEYDAWRGNKLPMMHWLVENFGGSFEPDRWNSKIDYERSAPMKLLEVYSFKNSQDAMLFKLRWL